MTTDGQSGRPVLSVVIPARDEAARLPSLLSDLTRWIDTVVGSAAEIVVVDDASTDGTGPVLEQVARGDQRVRVIHLERNVGHGPALRTGWRAARGRWIALLDGDGEVPVPGLAACWERRHDADLVVGVRQGRVVPRSRRWVSAGLRSLVRLSSGVALRDANCPCKLVSHDDLARADERLPPDAFAPSALLAIAVARAGRRVVEVAVPVADRESSRSWLVPRRLVLGCVRSVVDVGRVRRSVDRPVG